jgi:hypothetical protein
VPHPLPLQWFCPHILGHKGHRPLHQALLWPTCPAFGLSKLANLQLAKSISRSRWTKSRRAPCIVGPLTGEGSSTRPISSLFVAWKNNVASHSSPDARYVAVHLVALPATAVTAAHQGLSQSPGGITPQAFTLALRNLRPQWPDDGSLVLQLNAGRPEEQTWFSSDMVRSVLPIAVQVAC